MLFYVFFHPRHKTLNDKIRYTINKLEYENTSMNPYLTTCKYWYD